MFSLGDMDKVFRWNFEERISMFGILWLCKNMLMLCVCRTLWILVRFPNSLGCELGERRPYSLWIELPGPIVQIFLIGSGKMGTESESSTQNLGILISQTFKNSIGSAAERHFSLPPVCHFFGRPDIREVFVFNKFRICEKLHFRFLPWFPDRFAFNSEGNAL